MGRPFFLFISSFLHISLFSRNVQSKHCHAKPFFIHIELATTFPDHLYGLIYCKLGVLIGAKKLEFALILDLNTNGRHEVIGEADRCINEGTRRLYGKNVNFPVVAEHAKCIGRLKAILTLEY